MIWLMCIPLFFMTAFIIAYQRNRASLIPGFMLTLFLFSAMGALLVNLYQSEAYIIKWPFFILFFFLFFLFLAVMVFGVYVLAASLLINAFIVCNKEKRTLANCLTLIAAIGIILYLAVMRLADNADLPGFVRVAESAVEGLIFCYAVHITHYLIATILCNLSRPLKNQDYILVHGAGLINGKVTPLLAGRVDKAIQFYQMQKKVSIPPKIVLSGGQGKDEERPESEAMAEYAREKGIPASDVLLESKSATTFENMKFSKQIMDKDANGQPYRAIYVTSNYHLLRTGIYAKRAGLKMSGIGSKTALYYLPNALLREYIAYFFIYRKQNILFIVCSLLFFFATSWILTMLGAA